jgi:hypothetical protein
MGLLALISGFFYGGDVDRLGSPSFAERYAAHNRLSAAGWLAYPALWADGSDNPERAWRCDELMTRLDGSVWDCLAAEGCAKGLFPVPETATPAFIRLVCHRVDSLGGGVWNDSYAWVKGVPYARGTLTADCQYVIRSAAQRRWMATLFFPVRW